MIALIKLEHTLVDGWQAAIRGMRNPKNSWERSDSSFEELQGQFPKLVHIGENDAKLMKQLFDGGPVHRKFLRMITVSLDITAPLYWWKEYDTYKVATVGNSCSTMHKIHAKEFTLDDFSHEHLSDEYLTMADENGIEYVYVSPMQSMVERVGLLNAWRRRYLETKSKDDWWQLIQLLPSSYNQKRTVLLNYEVLANIYTWRKNHKLDEWREFCQWIEQLPYARLLITGDVKDE